MSTSTPTALAVDPGLLMVLGRWLAAAAPQEGCSLLLGERQGGEWRLLRLWPCCNVWPEPAERGRRFAIDPREQLVAQRWGRRLGLQVLGAAHSHPAGAAVPSPTDCQLCVAPALMVIQGEAADLRVWWLADDGGHPQPVPWRMEP